VTAVHDVRIHEYTSVADTLKPQVAYAAAVAGKIFERIQPIEMVNPQLRNGLRRRQPDIDSYASASLFVQADASPAKHAAAGWAEVNFQPRICLIPAGID
jgi:hypothetical protein